MCRPEPAPPRTPRPESGARAARISPVALVTAVAVVSFVTLVVARAAGAEPELEVSGAVVATTPRLQVSVVVTNRGDRPVPSLEIVGELLGQRRATQIPDGVVAGGSGTAVLDFDAARARPGVHALVLLLEHAIGGAPDAAGNPPLASQRAWLSVVLGEEAGPAVRLEPRPSLLAVRGRLEVGLGSADGAAHRVRVRAFTPRGLRSDGDGVEIEVPARGTVVAALPLVRAGAPRGTRHDVVLVAETVAEPLVRSSAVHAAVQVASDPSLLPRWRVPILVLACLLLGVAVGVEIWLRCRRPPPTRGD